MRVSREWSMPNRWTFKMKPVERLLNKYVKESGVGWANPFCGQSLLGDLRNDLDPNNAFAAHHMRASDFLASIESATCEGVLFDPPYSPRQISECYRKIGLNVGMKDTQNQWAKEKEHSARIIKNGGYCISFGWNSNGLGMKRGFQIVEILLIAHGGGHNDTICTVEQKKPMTKTNKDGEE